MNNEQSRGKYGTIQCMHPLWSLFISRFFKKWAVVVCVYGVSCAWMRQSLLLNLKIINLVRLNDKWDSGICPSPIQQDVELQTWPILLGCLHGFGGSRFLHSHRGSNWALSSGSRHLKSRIFFKSVLPFWRPLYGFGLPSTCEYNGRQMASPHQP